MRRSWRTFSLLLPQKKMLFNALPFDVCWFLVYRDRMGKTQPHHKRCQYVGQWGIFTCSCPRCLAYGTVDSHIHPFEQSHLTYLCSRVSATSCSHAPLPYSAFQVCLRSGAQTSAPHSSAGETSVNRILQKTVPQQTCCFEDIRMFLVAKSLWTNRFFSRYIIPHAIWAAHNLRSFWQIFDWWSIKKSSRAPIWTNSWTWNSIFNNIKRESQNVLYWYSIEPCQSYLLYILY